MRTYWIANTRTGDYLARVFPSSGQFKRVLCGSGSGEHTFRLGFGRRNRTQWRALLQGWARTLVVEEDGVVVYAGVIVKRLHRWKFWQTRVTHVDVREIFRRRFPFGVKSYWEIPEVQPGKLVLTNLTEAAIIARILEESLIGPVDGYYLPIVLPPSNQPGGVSLTLENYLLRTTHDILEERQNLDGGLDIDFRPNKNSSGKLEWVVDLGAPHIVKGSFDFNLTAPHPKLTDLTYDDDATEQLTGIFSVGAGSEADTAVGGVGISDTAGVPALDVVERHKTETDHAILASYSAAGIATLSHPTVQIGATILSTKRHNLATMPVGTMMRIYSKDDVWIPDGWNECRVISYAADMSNRFTVESQPLIGV